MFIELNPFFLDSCYLKEEGHKCKGCKVQENDVKSETSWVKWRIIFSKGCSSLQLSLDNSAGLLFPNLIFQRKKCPSGLQKAISQFEILATNTKFLFKIWFRSLDLGLKTKAVEDIPGI